MQMFEMLETYIKSLLLEQEEREQSKEQEIDSIKDLFQRWIDEYSASYLAFRKKVNPDSWVPAQISVNEHKGFIYISPCFKERELNDWFLIAYRIKDKNIYCINAYSFPYTLALDLTEICAHYINQRWINKISVDQFRRVMDVTKGNYAQFDALAKRLSDLNQRNANV